MKPRSSLSARETDSQPRRSAGRELIFGATLAAILLAGPVCGQPADIQPQPSAPDASGPVWLPPVIIGGPDTIDLPIDTIDPPIDTIDPPIDTIDLPIEPAPLVDNVDTDIEFYHLDALGSVRMVTNRTGAVVARYDYLPFGEEIPPFVAGRGQVAGYGAVSGTRRFTGKERDFESGLDYFGARYYSGPQGRFTSADRPERPQPIAYADVNDPQTFNLYAYARNSPLVNVDPDGRNWLVSGLFGAGIGMGIEGYHQVKSGRYRGPVERNARLAVAGGVGFGVGAILPQIVKSAPTLGAYALNAGLLGGGAVVVKKLANGVIDHVTDFSKGGTGENLESPKLVPTLKEVATGAIGTMAAGILGSTSASELGTLLLEKAGEAVTELVIHKQEEREHEKHHKEQHPPEPRPTPRPIPTPKPTSSGH